MKGKITAKFQTLKRVLIEYMSPEKVPGRSGNGPQLPECEEGG